MRYYGPSRSFALTVASALLLGVAFHLCLKRVQASDAGGAGSQIPECGKDQVGRAAGQKLELRAKKGEPLRFKCAASHTLGPKEEDEGNDLKKVFQVAEDGNGCATEPTPLTQLVAGAALTEAAEDGGSGDKSVYTFLYTSYPEAERHLCYTCDPPSASLPQPPSSSVPVAPPSGESDALRPGSSPGAVSPASIATPESVCTVRITVPKEDLTGSMTESPPAPTSDARGVTAGASAATGLLVVAMLRV